MESRTPIVNEIEAGKSWSVYWELRGIPEQSIARDRPSLRRLMKNATFTCGQKIYAVGFNVSSNHWNQWTLQLDIVTKKGNDKLNDQVSYFV